jgi:hypothetical protein
VYFLKRIFKRTENDWVNTKFPPIPKPLWGENMREVNYKHHKSVAYRLNNTHMCTWSKDTMLILGLRTCVVGMDNFLLTSHNWTIGMFFL